jgi:hypothetical protein
MSGQRLLTVLFLSTLLASACQTPTETPTVSTSPSPTPSVEPEARIAEEEARSQGNDYFDKSRTAVRRAAREFVKRELPKWTLKGMASESYEANVFWVDVDLESGPRKGVLSLIVKQFFPDSGGPYWKAFPLDKTHASQIHDVHDSVVEADLDQFKNP